VQAVVGPEPVVVPEPEPVVAVPEPVVAVPEPVVAVPEPVVEVPEPVVPVPRRDGSGRVVASPHARQLARQRGLDLSGVRGSGPAGAIVAADLDAAPVRKPARSDQQARTDATRAAIARAMARSKREIPHYYLETQVDLEPLLTWLGLHNATVPPPERILPAVPLLKAAALAARDVPEVNGFWRDEQLELADRVHLGVAVSLRRGGLVGPAIHDGDQLALPVLMSKLSDLVARARRGRLRGSELSDGTLTVTSMGERGVEKVVGVIYPPQVGIVGYGKITARPWVDGDRVVVRRAVTVTFSGDHRAHDGRVGGKYLNAIAKRLAAPEAL
jgi:pyruvate dehydrogenase E2 component (dihydrolipoamide acetyltransferase)